MKYNLYKFRFEIVLTLLIGLALIFDPATAQSLSYAGLALAVVNVKSTVITNADASPAVINTAQLANGRERHMRGVVAATSGDSIASVYRFFRVKSNDMVKTLLLDNATLGAGCTADFGLHRTAADGGAVVSVALFASAVDLNTAQRALDITRESGTITVANMEKTIWELLGLSADPQIEYDVTATLTAAAAATGAACVTGSIVGRN